MFLGSGHGVWRPHGVQWPVMPAPARIDPAVGVRTVAPEPTPGTVAGPERAPASASGVLVDVVVLTADMGLFHSIKDAVGERNPVWRARSAEEAADLLITGRCGVLLIDMTAVPVQADTLIEQIVGQFPETVVCVAGTRDDEPLLAPLISSGLVYRFIHKPASARRAGMFLQAAIKRHVEHRGRESDHALLPLLRSLTRPRAAIPRRYLLGVAAVCLVLVGLFLVRGVLVDLASTRARDAGPAPDPIPSAAAGRSDPVLSRARAALQAGRLEAPEARNALDLFEAVLLAQPEHEEARAGLDRTIDLLLERARKQADAGHKPEAERILQRVLAVSPRHAGAKALVQQVSPPDLPSRQLVREQVAEVRRRASEPTAASAPPMPLPRPQASEPAADLPEPVSSAYLARARSDRLPAPPVIARAVVATDPLAPNYLNAPRPRRVASWRTQPPPAGATMPVPLPIAGLASDSADAPATRPVVADSVGRTLPADEFDRIVAPDPVYPPQALRERTQGWVALEFTILATGEVGDIEVRGAKPIGVFEDAATAALARWRFRPRSVNGQPVAQRSSITLRFDVD
jgi:TonB family protein